MTAWSLVVCSLVLTPTLAWATEAGAKADARKSADDVKQQISKADHRIDEAGCTADKAECDRRKTHDHMEEAKERAHDDIHEVAAEARDKTK